MAATPAKFTFTLIADGDGPDEAIRVRRLLKRLARQHGLRVKWPGVAATDDRAAASRPEPQQSSQEQVR